MAAKSEEKPFCDHRHENHRYYLRQEYNKFQFIADVDGRDIPLSPAPPTHKSSKRNGHSDKLQTNEFDLVAKWQIPHPFDCEGNMNEDVNWGVLPKMDSKWTMEMDEMRVPRLSLAIRDRTRNEAAPPSIRVPVISFHSFVYLSLPQSKWLLIQFRYMDKICLFPDAIQYSTAKNMNERMSLENTHEFLFDLRRCSPMMVPKGKPPSSSHFLTIFCYSTSQPIFDHTP